MEFNNLITTINNYNCTHMGATSVILNWFVALRLRGVALNYQFVSKAGF